MRLIQISPIAQDLRVVKRGQSIRLLSFAITLTFSFVVARDANAAFIYSLRFDQPFYQVGLNQNVTVSLILREEVNGGSTNRITDTNGILFGNVRVNWNTSGPSFVSATRAFGGNITPPSDGGGFVYLDQESQNTNGQTGTQVSTFIREVPVGTVTLKLPGFSSATTISFSDPDSGTDDVTIKGFGSIDSLLAGNFGTATVANPEVSTFVLTGIGFVAAMTISRFRRRQKAVAERSQSDSND